MYNYFRVTTMVDIEHKTLEILKSHIDNLDYLLNNLDILRVLVFDEVSTIEVWNQVAREESYNELAVLILKSGKINKIAESLVIVGKRKNQDENMILAVISSFNNFFDKVYELYLLDQILYILTNFSLEELESLMVLEEGFVTNSWQLVNCFGIEERQTMLYDIYYEETYNKIYSLKLYYQERINSLLSLEEMKRKYELLNQRLRDIAYSEAQSFYANKLYIGLNTLVKKSREPRKRTRKVNVEQLEF